MDNFTIQTPSYSFSVRVYTDVVGHPLLWRVQYVSSLQYSRVDAENWIMRNATSFETQIKEQLNEN